MVGFASIGGIAVNAMKGRVAQPPNPEVGGYDGMAAIPVSVGRHRCWADFSIPRSRRRTSGIDVVAIPRDRVSRKHAPCLKTGVSQQGFGQLFRTSNKSTEEINFTSDAPGAVLGPEQIR